MAEERYITLEKEGCASFTERKSEFIGYAKPCKTEAEALAFIAGICKKHADARHNVYAYVLKENNIARFTDAGEPQGTAGLPVLDVIRKTGFTDACIVVTRYFGGILLGTGGLVRAYSRAAKLAAEAAHIVVYERFRMCECVCDYSDYKQVVGLFPVYGVLVDENIFAQDVTLHLAVRAASYDAFVRAVTDITGGTVLIEPCGERFDCLPAETVPGGEE